MTYVTTTSNLPENNSEKFYIIEVITFDGDSECVEVEARTAEEAQIIAAREVPNADYTMVQAIVQPW